VRYLSIFPGAHALAVIGDYNASRVATRRAWTPFSMSEIQELAKRVC
jgi:hypothetical protein